MSTSPPLYRHPRKIWGIGLNYREHAVDLGASFPTEPASFMKADHTIIGPGDYIVLPSQSERTTAEAELGVVIGKTCRDVSVQEAMSYVAGVCLILDMTAEDMVVKNPRYLTRAKNFDTFFSFGPELITLDEVSDLLDLKVGTYKNGSLWRENVVANMAFPPDHLVSFHSHVAPLFPGDIISTGTPRGGGHSGGRRRRVPDRWARVPRQSRSWKDEEWARKRLGGTFKCDGQPNAQLEKAVKASLRGPITVDVKMISLQTPRATK